MFSVILLTIVLVAWVDCKFIVISGPTWKNSMKACASGGEHSNPNTFDLGNLSEYNEKYEDINSKTTVIAEGDLQLKTGKEGWIPKTELHLSQFSESSDYKQYRGKWYMESYRGWASQTVQMILTLKVYDSGKIYLETYASAGSWLSVTCAESRVYVERIKMTTSADRSY